MLWCVPAGFAFVLSRMNHWPSPWPQLTIIPAAVGCVLIAVVILRIVRSLREGRPTLFFSESGTSFKLRFTFPDRAFEGRRAVAVVRCERYTTWSDGEMTDKTLWSNRCTMKVQSGECTGLVERPRDLPPKPPGRDASDVWYVDLECGGYWLTYPV